MTIIITLLSLLMPLLFLVPAPSPIVEASADEVRYAVAADTNVWFYSSESDSARLFLIPETYYVRVLYEGETYSAVEYLENDAPYEKVVGYCRTQALTFVDFVPERPFLKRQITVSYTIPEGGGAFEDVFGSIERTFVYYGTRYEYGQLYFYVLSDGQFGYIPAEKELEFDRNDDWLTVPSGPADGSHTPAGSSLSAWQIVALCVGAAAAIAIGALVLRGKKHSPPETPEP